MAVSKSFQGWHGAAMSKGARHQDYHDSSVDRGAKKRHKIKANTKMQTLNHFCMSCINNCIE